jgi:protein-tyrosine phosphatase
MEDFDAEGRRLMEQMSRGARFNDLDVVATHAGGGKVYVGNYTAAQKKEILDAHGIRHIVNCQDVTSENYHENNPDFKYFRFPISHWWREAKEISSSNVEAADQAAIKYFDRLFDWADPVLARGENILVHCLAGAHRAGTTGVVYLMHLEKLRFKDALPIAQGRRGQINPIGTLMQLAIRYDEAIGRTTAISL